MRKTMVMVGLTENPGGKELFIKTAINALKDDYQIYVVADRTKVAFQSELEEAGASFRFIPSRRANFFEFIVSWWKILKNIKPDVIWVHATVINSIESLILAKLFGTQIRILHSHSSANMSGRVSGILHRINKPIVPFIVTKKFACSPEAAQWFFGSKRWTFVPNVFQAEKFTFDPKKRQNVRQSLGLTRDENVLIHVARLGPAKNHEFDIALMNELAKTSVKCKLLLVGDGPFREQLEAKVQSDNLQDRIMFLGQRDDVPQLLSVADISILPSTFEGLPYSVLEAQAAGLPCLVSTAVSELAELPTGRVEWLSLDKGVQPWVEAVMRLEQIRDTSRHNAALHSGFDANEARALFISIIT